MTIKPPEIEKASLKLFLCIIHALKLIQKENNPQAFKSDVG